MYKALIDILQEKFPNPSNFLEIGCWDGEHISQTAYLEREKGWAGVCVDPFPRNFANREATLVSKAISNDGKDKEFTKVYYDKRDGGDVSYFSGFSDTLNDHWNLIKEHCHYEKLMIKTITMEELYKRYNLPVFIEFLSVDTEGSEFEILDSIDFTKCEFGIILAEHNYNKEKKANIDELLISKGYFIYKELEIDTIYINNKLL